MEYNIYQKKSNSPFIVILLPLLLFCPFCVFGQIAKVNKVWLEHGTLKNGGKGITIHADINVNGMKGKEIKAIAYFYDSEKNKLMGGVSGYKTKNGQVCASDYGTPSYDKSHYKDFNIFIPYVSLPLLSGKHTYYVSLRIQDKNSHNFISEKGNFVSFTGTGNSGNRDSYVRSNSRQNSQLAGLYEVRSYREPSSYGIVVIKEFSNGSKVRCWYRPCPNCKGSVKCSMCYGTGKCSLCGGRGYYTIDMDLCPSCRGLGFCSMCKGRGVCRCENQENPGYYLGKTTVYGPDGSVTRFNDADNGHKNSSSSSSSSFSSGSCSRCHGTGVDPSPDSGGSMSSWIAYHNNSGDDCPYCNYFTSHNHTRCSRCNIPKY